VEMAPSGWGSLSARNKGLNLGCRINQYRDKIKFPCAMLQLCYNNAMLNTLSPQEEVIIKKLIDVFSDNPDVEEIILYGSRARGDSDENSDMDILVLYSGEIKNIEAIKMKVLEEIEDYLYLSIVPYHVEEFREGKDEFVKNVKKEGIVIWRRRGWRK